MLPIVICESEATCRNALEKVLSYTIVKGGLKACLLRTVSDQRSMSSFLTGIDGETARHLLCFIGTEARMDGSGGREIAQLIRKRTTEAHLVFVGSGMNGMGDYLRPGIRPSAFLARPVSPHEVVDVFREVYREHLLEVGIPAGRYFPIQSGDEMLRVPAREILFLEALEKRINLHTTLQVFRFASTLRDSLSRLPSHFLQCHRCFIVNPYQILSANFTSLCIRLSDGSSIYMSRRFRDSVRVALQVLGTEMEGAERE